MAVGAMLAVIPLTLLTALLPPSRYPSRRCRLLDDKRAMLKSRGRLNRTLAASSGQLLLAELVAALPLVAGAPRGCASLRSAYGSSPALLALLKSLEYSRKHLEEFLNRKNNSLQEAYIVCRVLACF